MQTSLRAAGVADEAASSPPTRRRLSAGSMNGRNNNYGNAEEEDEEELRSLNLSREGSLMRASSNDDDADYVVNRVGGVGGVDIDSNKDDAAPTMMMVGTNRKSAFPATPATPAVPVSRLHQQQYQQQQQRGSGGGGPPIRRTPGPMSVAQQARHRLTPGAGPPHNDRDISRNHAKTPVMSGGSNRQGKTPHKLRLASTPSSSSSLVTPSNKTHQHNNTMETPNFNNTSRNSSSSSQQQQHQRQLYTPAHFTLAKNPELHMENRPDALSPATIRMTDSLEKILTDDDDLLEAKQRAIMAQQQMQPKAAMNNQNMVPDNTNGSNVMFDSSYPMTREDIPGRGGFRRIQSTGSDDEEMDQGKDLVDVEGGSKTGDSSQEDEEEAEISLINEDEDADEDDTGMVQVDTSISRPKPLNLSGGAFKPPTTTPLKSRVAAVPIATPEIARATKQGLVHTPKPQRTVPRHPSSASYGAQGGATAGGYHPNQGQGGMYYPPQQQHAGYFGAPLDQFPASSNMLFPHEQHQLHHPPSPHLQYNHGPHHQQFTPQQHHPSQNFYLPSMPSPQNAGFGIPHPSGAVSPLAIPPDYSHGYHHHPHANVGGPYQHQQHSMHPIPPEFGGGPGVTGDQWSWRPADHNMSQQHQGMHHPHHQDNLQQQPGMGIPTIPGHASPDFSYHEHLSGSVSPFNMPSYNPYPATVQHHHPAHHANPNYSQRHHNHHQSQGHHPRGSNPSSSSRQRTLSKESASHRANSNFIRKPSSSPAPLTASPKKQSPPSGCDRRLQRPPRKDSAGSLVSTFSGSGEDPQGNISSFSQTAVSSPASSSTSALRLAFPGIVPSASSEEHQELDGQHREWFYPSHNNSSMSSGISGTYSKQHESYGQQQQQLKGRARKGSYDGTPMGGTGRMAMQNISGSSSNSRLVPDRKHQGKKLSGKQQQHPRERGGINMQQHQQHHRQVPPHLDHVQTGAKDGRNGGPSVYRGEATRGNINNSADQDEKQFVMESPTERQAYKEFGRNFRQRELNDSLDAASDYALACLDADSHPELYLPPATHWRVFLELADVAKRSNRTDEAREHYKRACQLQPRASQGWLEHSKLEEESGNLTKCADILQEGLRHCTTNENLLIRAVKFYERMGNLDGARMLLSRLKYLSIDKSWKTMLEGALLEARAGRYSLAREVLKFLTHHVPWYGPLYLAHTKLERDYGSSAEAFSIVEKGLKELPRYGPLYFQAFRLLEKEDLAHRSYDLPCTMDMVVRADSISRELLWKVHLEAAQMQERAAVLAVEESSKNSLKLTNQLDLRTALQPTRRSYAKAIMLCPPNLSWKIWLASGRTEVSCGNTKSGRDLFLRAYDSVSEKGRSTVLLECARLEEYLGDLALSRSILCKARNLFGRSDWKVWLSSVNLECRCGLKERAIQFAQEALNIHRGTGRLWAALIQLRHDDGVMHQVKVLKCALQAVPKSGEVWCEGARIHLNPFSPTFDLRAASRHLAFAARFTPQYGDSFLEQLRLDMIDQWLIPLAAPFINGMYDAFLSSCTGNDKPMPIKDAYQFIAKHSKKAADVMKTQLEDAEGTKVPLVTKKDVLDTSKLELRCSSADPNYGHLWFQCRNSPIDTAREVIARAKTVMVDFIVDYSHLYVAAMVRRAGVLMLVHQLSAQRGSMPSINSRKYERMVNEHLRSVPALNEMLSVNVGTGSLFTTGCGGNSSEWEKLSLAEKRRILFGSDSLLN